MCAPFSPNPLKAALDAELINTRLPNGRPRHEVAEILRLYGNDYRAKHPLPLHVHRVLNAIQNCRTAALGGHQDICTECGAIQQPSYNSCRDRHCPKCQGLQQAQWVEARKDELLPVPYFHVVFTLPHDINIWAYWNPEVIYELLFKIAAKTLQEFSARYWKGELGITAVLHTWGQSLEYHIHLHCIVPGGALSFDGETFKPCPHRTWLFPIEALSRVFREKYLSELQRLFDNGELTTPPEQNFPTLCEALRKHEWVVYAKPPFSKVETVIEYLSRYTHRIAISNSRIIDISEGNVSFTWKDYQDDSKIKIMTLTADKFIRRFITHILPPRFVRIRHFGLLSCGHRAKKLNHVRALLGLPAVEHAEQVPYDELLLRLSGEDVHACPFCGGRLQPYRTFLPWQTPPPAHDPPMLREAA
jgi:hypothetical protein